MKVQLSIRVMRGKAVPPVTLQWVPVLRRPVARQDPDPLRLEQPIQQQSRSSRRTAPRQRSGRSGGSAKFGSDVGPSWEQGTSSKFLTPGGMESLEKMAATLASTFWG